MFSFFENTLQLKLEARSQVRTLGTRLLKLHSNLVTLVRRFWLIQMKIFITTWSEMEGKYKRGDRDL